MDAGRKPGRKPKEPRFKLQLTRIENGAVSHIFSVISKRTVSDLMKLMQSVSVRAQNQGDNR